MISTARWSIFALLLLGLGPIPVKLTAETRPIACDLHSCIALATAQHPLLKASAARQSAARSERSVRLAERRPILDLEGETGYLEGKAITPFSALSGVTEEGIEQRRVSGGYYQASVGLEVPLIKEGTLVGQVPSSVRQAQLRISEEDWQARMAHLHVALQVVEAYVQVLQHRKAIQAAEAIAAALEEGYKLAQVRFQQDLISRNELLIGEVRLATARRELTHFRLALQRSQHTLRSSMGLDTSGAVEIQDLQEALAPLPPVADLLALAQQTHPELKAHQFRVESSVAEVDRIRSERYPTLSLTARYGFVDAFEGSPNAQWLAAMNVKVPLFDFGLTRKKAEVARAKVIEEEQQRLNFQLNIEQEIHHRYLQLQELDDHVQLLTTQIEQATEEMKLKRAMFQQELAPQAAVLDAEAALFKWQLAHTQAQYERQLRRLQLSLISGEWSLPASSR